MTSEVNTPRQLPIDRLVEAFQACLLALIPQMDAVGVAWRDGKAYDDWDRIESALFESVISTPIEFTPSEGASERLAGYKSSDVLGIRSTLFDEELGEAFKFHSLWQTNTPFDTACFRPEKGKDLHKPVTECRFRVLIRSRRSAETTVTALANID